MKSGKSENLIRLGEIIVIGSTILFLLWVLASLFHVERVQIPSDNIRKTVLEDSSEYLIQLPTFPGRGDYCLMFKSTGNVVSVWQKGQRLYSYGRKRAEGHRDIGSVYFAIEVDPEVQEVHVVLQPSDHGATDEITGFELCRQKEVSRYYMTNETLGFLPALFYFVLGVCCLSIALILRKRWELYRLCLYFGFILCLMGVELMDSGGHYMVFGISPHVWNINRYLASYFLPVFCLLYSYEILRDKFSRKEGRVLLIGVVLSSLYAMVVICLIAFTRFRFCDFADVYFLLILLCLGIAVYGSSLIVKKKLLNLVNGVVIIFSFIVWLVMVLILNSNLAKLQRLADNPRIDIETLGAVFVFFIAALFFISAVIKSQKEKHQKKIQVLELENALKESHIRMFSTQMQPHFLYNALSSIQEVVLIDPDHASRLISDFTAYLRGCIKSMTAETLIPFSQELNHIKAYVHIEEIRFADRLKIFYEIENEDFMIVPLSIQPLVENAIRHGIYGRGPAGGTVWIRCYKENDIFIIQVQDTGTGFDPGNAFAEECGKEHESHGLKNLTFRLKQSLQASLDIQSEVGVGTVATVRIPRQKANEGEEI